MTADPRDTDTSTVLPDLLVRPVDREALERFARASGQSVRVCGHATGDRAEQLDDVLAHGMLSMAHAARLITSWVPQNRIRSFDVRFMAITPLFSEPRCAGRVVSVEEVDGEVRARIELRSVLHDGTVALIGSAVVAID